MSQSKYLASRGVVIWGEWGGGVGSEGSGEEILKFSCHYHNSLRLSGK